MVMKRNYIKKFLRLVNSKMRIFIAILIIIISFQANSQNYGGLSGNFQLNYQTFQEDSSINAEALGFWDLTSRSACTIFI